MFESCDVKERLRHFDGIVPSLACILMKQRGVHGGKYLLKRHLQDSKFQNVPTRCLGPQELVPLVQVPKPPTIRYQSAT